MENWSAAQKEISQTSDLDDDIGELPLKIIRSNSTTPMIKVDADGNIEYNNINLIKANEHLHCWQVGPSKILSRAGVTRYFP